MALRGGAYARLSRDEDREDYASITAQMEMIKQYAKEHEIEIIKPYEDDDVSGYKFNGRKGFNELLDDLENNVIDVVLAKDLSRIGRHNAHTLLFIENVKSMNKTLIAIDDDYNSSKDNDDIIGIKTWFNERYVKDLSKKIRSNIKSYMRSNTYINSLPYGYYKDPVTKQIAVDESLRLIIQRIYKMYLEGNGIQKIANVFNKEEILTPLEHQRLLAEQKGKYYKNKTSNKWYDSTVMNILKNDFYIGVKRHHTTVRDGMHGKIKYINNEKEQIIFYDNHEAIINKGDFEIVQELIQKRKNLNYRGEIKYSNPYTGFLICSTCGKALLARNQKGRLKCYVCSTYKKFGKEQCTSHHVTQEELDIAIKNKLEFLSEALDDFMISLNDKLINRISTNKNYDSVIRKTESEVMELESEYRVLQSQKIKQIAKNPSLEDTINKQYEDMERDVLQKINILSEQLKNFKTLKEQSQYIQKEVANAKDLINQILKEEHVNKRILEFLLEKIIINEQGYISIFLKPQLEYLFTIKEDSNINLASASKEHTEPQAIDEFTASDIQIVGEEQTDGYSSYIRRKTHEEREYITNCVNSLQYIVKTLSKIKVA